MRIGIIGSGNVARQIGLLCQRVDHTVCISARNPRPDGAEKNPRVVTPAEAAEYGEIVIVAIPFTACAKALPPLRALLSDKIVVDATNPLDDNWQPLLLGQENSAGEEIARLLPDSPVVKAFNTIFADAMVPALTEPSQRPISAFLCGDRPNANAAIADFLRGLGLAPVDTGPMRCARYLEAMAHLNIQIAVNMGGGTKATFMYH